MESARIFDQLIEQKNFREGIRSVKWPGRMETLNENIYFDVSHNVKGIEVTINTLKKIYPNKQLVGIMCLKKVRA